MIISSLNGINQVYLLEGDRLVMEHCDLGKFHFYVDKDTSPFSEWLFTENDTHHEALFNQPNKTEYHKDAFHRHVVDGEEGVVNPANKGTKSAAWIQLKVPAGENSRKSAVV